MSRARAFLILLIVQALCALVFVLDIVLPVLGLFPRHVAWTRRN